MMALEPITRQEQIIAGKDLEPITRMEKFLKEYGGGGGSGGGGGAQPDWNAAEGEPGHILNRPFYSERESVEFTYDADNPNNTTMADGKIVYYASSEYFYWDNDTLSIWSDGMDDGPGEIQHHTGTDTNGDEFSVQSMHVALLDLNDYSPSPNIIFNATDIGENPVTIDYNGESITFAAPGWYVARTPDGCRVYNLTTEDVTTIDKKYLPKADPVTDAAGENVTAEEFNALLSALRSAGYLSE